MDYLIGSLALNLLVLFYLSVLSVVFINTFVFSLDLTLFVLSFWLLLNVVKVIGIALKGNNSLPLGTIVFPEL